MMRRTIWTLVAFVGAVVGCKGPLPTSPAVIAKEPTRLYWGDTHLHTSHSPDAYFLGNRSADPHTAYRWAKGLPVVHPYTQAKVQIDTPLDFLVVAEDGLVEAFSVIGAPGFTLGVQWHPEWKPLESEVSMAIFRCFGDACREYRLRDLRQ